MVTASAEEMAMLPWYGPESYQEAGSLELAVPVFAVNLLSAELRLKRSDTQDVGSDEHQEDADILAYLVSNLLPFMSALSKHSNDDKRIIELQCRCLWLATSYYTLIGRTCSDASISKHSEGFGLEYLNETMSLLSSNSIQIKTPHLGSPDRHGYIGPCSLSRLYRNTKSSFSHRQ